jgi:flavodoxin
MNIGIIVYSHTGHTLSVAMKLEEKLSAAGHRVTLERIETVGPATLNAEDAELETASAVGSYDALIFGAPVRGGTPAPPMRNYLEQIPSLHDKKVVCFVTHFFRWEWGANQTITQMTEICESKGATVCGSGHVQWPSLRRKRQISQVVDDLSRLF